MSSVLAPSVVVSGPTFTTPDPDGIGVTPPVTIFTVPAFQAVLIDAVYMVAEYNDTAGWGDVFTLRLVDQSGLVVAAVKSGEQTNTPLRTYELTWTRTGVDSGFNGEDFWNFQLGESGRSWWTGALPELVLQAGSTVQVQVYRAGLVPDPPQLLVDQVAIAYTPAGGATSSADTPQGIPLLTATAV